MKKIERVIALTAGTTAATVDIRGMAFLMENNSDSASVYFKEKRDDGADAAADNGWRLPPATAMPFPLTAMDLSVIASAADTDVRLLILDEC